jgi:hypothetical protein
LAGYPKTYNIEMDPNEDLDVATLFLWPGSLHSRPSANMSRRWKTTGAEEMVAGWDAA